MLYNIPVITCSNEKKEEKMQKEYSVQEEFKKIHNENSNMNLNYKEINMKNQYIEPVSNLAHTMYVINLNIKILIIYPIIFFFVSFLCC